MREHILSESDLALFDPTKHLFMVLMSAGDPGPGVALNPALADVEAREVVARLLVECARQIATMPDDKIIKLPI